MAVKDAVFPSEAYAGEYVVARDLSGNFYQVSLKVTGNSGINYILPYVSQNYFSSISTLAAPEAGKNLAQFFVMPAKDVTIS